MTETVSEAQSADAVLMVRPARFASNPQTEESNAFQRRPDLDPDTAQEIATREFDGLVAALTDAGVDVCVFDDTEEPETPDSVFPNNWVTFHADGTVVLYPMLAVNRRTERREDIIADLSTKYDYRITQTIDLTGHEQDHRFLEGTGSVVLDRVNRIAYACVSPRTDLDALGDFSQRLDYDLVVFEATDSNGVAIYHTNVMMCLGTAFAVICLESIRDEAQCAAVQCTLERTGHEIVATTLEQMEQFAGNMLELRNRTGETLIAMSARAFGSLTPEQRATLERYGRIVSAPIENIEDHGGGSVRCMLAEIHLPKKGSKPE